ncbi:hypothetical protein [Geminicoccus roseus]|uniref:hypothetical protein n=1 Tax=Geminicoccus roseus TaxID=404900 RepID=UPI000404BA89|nr:hypothetical protein [Geminicoccus roseus]
MTKILKRGRKIDRAKLLRAFVELQYKRNHMELARGKFRAKGDVIQSSRRTWRTRPGGSTRSAPR